MKMKMKLLTLATAALAVSSGFSSASFAADGNSVGDLPGYGEASYYAPTGEDADEAAYASDVYPDDQVEPVGHQTVGSGFYAPISASEMQGGAQQVNYVDGCGSSACGCGDSSVMSAYGSSCDMGCSSGGCCESGCGSCSMGASLCNPCSGSTWGSMEALMWFVEGRDVPPLVTQSDAGTSPNLPEGDARNAQILYGNQIDSGLAAGFRLDIGTFVADNIGFGGRYWQLFDGNESYEASGDGSTRSLGVPFFNTDTGVESAFLIGEQGSFQGTVNVESELELLAAEAYARIRFSGGKCHSLDLIGGYTRMELDDTLSLNTNVANTDNTGAPTNPVGTIRTTSDLFETKNTFDGGQIGFEAVVARGKWMFRSLTKVHLGNMKQSVGVAGSATRLIPAAALENFNAGLLSQSNEGNGTTDEFAFIPEANIKLAYAFRPNVSVSVGYSFLYIDNVALAGGLIDRNVDATALFTDVGSFNPLTYTSSDLYVHGVDVGCVFEF